jgi:hypothetical protein
MGDKDKIKLENGLVNSLSTNRKFPGTFLEPGEKFTDRLQTLVRESLKPPGADVNELVPGKVLKVVQNAKPTPGGMRDRLNKENNFQNLNCLQLYVHTAFDSGKAIPSNLINPGVEESLIYQHYVYEGTPELDNQPPNVGDDVYVYHPWKSGYLNRVGIYMGIVAKCGVPLSEEPGGPIPGLAEARIVRKMAIPVDLPEEEECEKDPYGDNCAWSRGRVIGKIDLNSLPGPRSGFRAKPEVVTAYENMKRSFESDNPGATMKINSGFRTYKQQEQSRKRWAKKGKPKNAAKPGFSRHQNGIALDISTKGSKPPKYITKVYEWLRNNAPQYGFVRTVRSEPWHWVYYGPTKAAKRIPSWQ